jgi:NAD(P)-dependent dehydrogenase (short-subunit alcohol dehydrogenase family)
MNLRNKLAVLTAAGSGIGRVAAQALARRVCHLALADLNPQELRQTPKLVKSHGVRVGQHVLDVASREQVAALKKRLERVEKMLRMPPRNTGDIIATGIERAHARELVGLDAKTASVLERLSPVHYWHLLGNRSSI